MIVCTRCGLQTETPAQFCPKCGAFLEWEGQKLPGSEPADLAPSASGDTAVSTLPTTGATTAVPATVGSHIGEENGGVALPAAPLANLGRAGLTPVDLPASLGPPPGGPQLALPPTDPAAPASLPPAGSAADVAPTEPQAVKPSRGRIIRSSSRPTDGYAHRVAQPGDLICGQCGEANPPDRHFCRLCAGSLAEAAVVRLSWWRRLLHRPPPPPEGGAAREAGPPALDEPAAGPTGAEAAAGVAAIGSVGAAKAPGGAAAGASGTKTTALPTLKKPAAPATTARVPKVVPPAAATRAAALQKGLKVAPTKRTLFSKRNLRRASIPALVVVVAVFALVPTLRHSTSHAFTSTKNGVTNLVSEQVEAVLAPSVRASSSLTGHPAGLLIDGNADSYWATAPAVNDGLGQSISLNFGANGPTAVDYVIITSGAQAPDNFAYQGRPETLLLVFNSDETRTIHLQDSAKPQTFKVSAKSVKTLVIQIEAVYPGSSEHSCAIAELEFRKVKH